MGDFELTTPVVFIIFNRPDKTREVFREIARARPSRLLLISDGPRASREGEAERVAQTRRIASAVDWPCSVSTNFSEINLGCRERISTGLDSAFREVSEAIILEDDCVPDPSFFRFCQELLDKYRDDQRIGMISGDNFQKSYRLNSDSYYFSNNTNIWGWATWSDRWIGSYDVKVEKWRKFKAQAQLSEFWDDPAQQKSFEAGLDGVFSGTLDTWDYQWLFANRINGRLSIMPNVNLISNIGFDQDATHTTRDSPYSRLPMEPMLFPLQHPDAIFANRSLDRRAYRLFESPPLLDRVRRRLARLRGRR